MPNEKGGIVTGCLKHRRFQHPSGEWVGFTEQQLISVRAVYTYCNRVWTVTPIPCDQCQEEVCGMAAT